VRKRKNTRLYPEGLKEVKWGAHYVVEDSDMPRKRGEGFGREGKKDRENRSVGGDFRLFIPHSHVLDQKHRAGRKKWGREGTGKTSLLRSRQERSKKELLAELASWLLLYSKKVERSIMEKFPEGEGEREFIEPNSETTIRKEK